MKMRVFCWGQLSSLARIACRPTVIYLFIYLVSEQNASYSETHSEQLFVVLNQLMRTCLPVCVCMCAVVLLLLCEYFCCWFTLCFRFYSSHCNSCSSITKLLIATSFNNDANIKIKQNNS